MTGSQADSNTTSMVRDGSYWVSGSFAAANKAHRAARSAIGLGPAEESSCCCLHRTSPPVAHAQYSTRSRPIRSMSRRLSSGHTVHLLECRVPLQRRFDSKGPQAAPTRARGLGLDLYLRSAGGNQRLQRRCQMKQLAERKPP